MTTMVEPLLSEAEFQSVYIGRYGECCCGCAGKHIYPERLRDLGNIVRGYPLNADEVSDKRFKAGLQRLEKLLREGQIDMVSGGFISARDGNQLVTGYFTRQLPASE